MQELVLMKSLVGELEVRPRAVQLLPEPLVVGRLQVLPMMDDVSANVQNKSLYLRGKFNVNLIVHGTNIFSRSWSKCRVSNGNTSHNPSRNIFPVYVFGRCCCAIRVVNNLLITRSRYCQYSS